MIATKEERIDLRTDNKKKSILKMAAGLRGKTLTDFILDEAYPKAEEIVASEQPRRIELDAESWKAFCERLDTPPQENEGLKRLMARPSVFSDE